MRSKLDSRAPLFIAIRLQKNRDCFDNSVINCPNPVFLDRNGASFFKELTKALLLLSMLVISISKEKTEDEYTMSLRTKSYALAFIVGVLYTIFQPYINYGVDTILSAEKVTFTQLGSFPIIWFMLFVQLSFYHVLKYNR